MSLTPLGVCRASVDEWRNSFGKEYNMPQGSSAVRPTDDLYLYINIDLMPVPVAARSKGQVYGRSPAGIVGSNPIGDMYVCCECCVLSRRGLCDELITRPEESYRLWCVWMWSWILDNEEAMAYWWVIAPREKYLTLNLLTTTIVAPPSNASKWQMEFNSAFKELNV